MIEVKTKDVISIYKDLLGRWDLIKLRTDNDQIILTQNLFGNLMEWVYVEKGWVYKGEKKWKKKKLKK